MSNLKSLVYVSSAVRDLGYTEIEYLLNRARERNLEHNITGVLMFIGGNFMQYIEGEVDDLAQIYKIIKADPLHTGLIQLLHHPIEKRDFSDWTMAYCTKDRTVLVGAHNDTEILDGKLGFSSCKQTPSRILLHNFWSKNGS